MSKVSQQDRDSSVALEGIQKQNKSLTEDPHDAPEAASVQIPQDVAKKLERMRFITAAIKSDEKVLNNKKVMAEYSDMLGELVATFLPLVKLIVSAGLLTVNINIEDIGDLQRHSTLTGEPTIAFDNGNIWVDTEYAGGNLRKRRRKRARKRRSRLARKQRGAP